MAIETANDTKSYEGTDGRKQLALGVVIMGGALDEAGNATSIGSPDDTPWDGVAASASLIAIMKYCGQQLAQIVDNTGGPA